MSAPAVSESGSYETGRCSNVSDSGRVCNAPRSSVLFDGIPTLTGLEGDMWASQLLTLNTSASSTSITFDFTNPTDRNGPTSYAGVSVIEVVMFNCPARGIGTNNVQVLANYGITYGSIAVSASCEYLVRVCSAIFVSPSLQEITLSFNKIYARLHIAEITFYGSFAHQCSTVGPLTASVISTTEHTSKFRSNQENGSTYKQTYPPTLASETSNIVFLSSSTQDINSSLSPTSESVPSIVKDNNINTSTEYMSSTSIQGSHNLNVGLANNELS